MVIWRSVVTRFLGDKMRIAITGGLGFIGKWVLSLLPDNVDVTIISRNYEGTFSINNREFYSCITDYSYDSLCKILAGNDAVLHLAAQRQNEQIQDQCMYNVLVDFELFRACETCNISNVVFTSSVAIYGDQAAPWKETNLSAPKSMYGLAKYQSEQTAAFFNSRGLFIKSLRVAQVLGLGERSSSVTTVFLRKALNKEKISLTGGVNIRREYIYVKDLVDALFLALSEPTIKGVFNLGSGFIVSIEELAHIVNFYFENVGNLEYSSELKAINEYSLMDSSLFATTFRWRPRWTIEEAILDIRNTLNGGMYKNSYNIE